MERIKGKYETLSQARNQQDLESGVGRGLWYDEAAADRAVSFFSRFLKHHKGEWAGRPFILDPWQEHDIIRPMFGWMRADGTRRYRTGYVEIPRKNGKSTLAAGIGLYLTIADGEAGAEVYSSATKKDQAKIVHDAAKQMVRGSRELSKFVTVLRNNISVERIAAKFEPLGADSNTLDGLNAHGNIVDELHAHRDRTVWDVLITSMGARRQPLTLAITTAGTYVPTSIGWEQHDYAVKVLEGIIEDDSYFVYIAAADKDDDWTDPATWYRANPALGISIKEEYLREQCEKAKSSPAFQNTFRRLHLNQWTEQTTRWIDMDKWGQGARPLDPLEGRVCFAGLDLASTTDLTALVLVFPDEDYHEFDVLAKFWVPGERMVERVRRDRVPYDAWARDGYLDVTDGDVFDDEAVRLAIRELGELYDIKEIAYDRWGASSLAPKLAGDGFLVVPMGQGFASMAAPTKELDRLIVGGLLRHAGNPILAWMASNVAVRQDPAGNIKIDKSKSTERVDGMVALVMGLDRALRHQLDDLGPSVYETRGVISL